MILLEPGHTPYDLHFRVFGIPVRVHPMFWLVAAIMGLSDFAFLIFVVAMRFLWSHVQPGWASTNFFNAIMFGCLFLVLAVVCEYMAEMRGDIKRRPLYVVQCELQSNIMLVDMERRNVVSHEERPEALSPTRLSRSVPS